MFNPLPVWDKLQSSGSDEKTALGLRETNAVPRFAPTPRAQLEFFNTVFDTFSDALSPFLPRLWNKSLNPSACTELSQTVKDWSLLRIGQ